MFILHIILHLNLLCQYDSAVKVFKNIKTVLECNPGNLAAGPAGPLAIWQSVAISGNVVESVRIKKIVAKSQINK